MQKQSELLEQRLQVMEVLLFELLRCQSPESAQQMALRLDWRVGNSGIDKALAEPWLTYLLQIGGVVSGDHPPPDLSDLRGVDISRPPRS